MIEDNKIVLDEDQQRSLVHQVVIGRSRDPRVQLIRSIMTSAMAFCIDFFLLMLFVNLLFKRYVDGGATLFWVDLLNNHLFELFGTSLSVKSAIILLSSIVSYLAGTLFVYFLSISWVFPDRSVKKRHHEIVIFYLLAGIGVSLNALLIWRLTKNGAVPISIAKIIAGTLIFFFNFTARKVVLFRNKKA